MKVAKCVVSKADVEMGELSVPISCFKDCREDYQIFSHMESDLFVCLGFGEGFFNQYIDFILLSVCCLGLVFSKSMTFLALIFSNDFAENGLVLSVACVYIVPGLTN